MRGVGGHVGTAGDGRFGLGVEHSVGVVKVLFRFEEAGLSPRLRVDEGVIFLGHVGVEGNDRWRAAATYAAGDRAPVLERGDNDGAGGGVDGAQLVKAADEGGRRLHGDASVGGGEVVVADVQALVHTLGAEDRGFEVAKSFDRSVAGDTVVG